MDWILWIKYVYPVATRITARHPLGLNYMYLSNIIGWLTGPVTSLARYSLDLYSIGSSFFCVQAIKVEFNYNDRVCSRERWVIMDGKINHLHFHRLHWSTIRIIALISSHTLPNDDRVELLTQFSHIMNDIKIWLWLDGALPTMTARFEWYMQFIRVINMIVCLPLLW